MSARPADNFDVNRVVSRNCNRSVCTKTPLKKNFSLLTRGHRVSILPVMRVPAHFSITSIAPHGIGFSPFVLIVQIVAFFVRRVVPARKVISLGRLIIRIPSGSVAHFSRRILARLRPSFRYDFLWQFFVIIILVICDV